METKYNVSVTLTPLEHYFFGSENLNTDGSEKYLQRSNQLPQQTTVLGAMRFLLLQLADKSVFANNKIQDKEAAKLLIGESSFNMSAAKYGKIEALSEVLLWNNGFHLPMLAWTEKVKEVGTKEKINKEVGSPKGTCFFGMDLQKNGYELPNYEAKKGIGQYWIGQNGQPFEGNIFTEYCHAGNFKNKENKAQDDDDAYFKMCYYRLHSDFSFVFNMQISDENTIQSLIKEKRIIHVGGERSKFICVIEKIEKALAKHITDETYKKAYSCYSDPNFTKVVLTSDAYIESNPYAESLMAIAEITKMRFMQSSVDRTEAYSNRTQAATTHGKAGLTQSRLFNLLKRGSVFYFKKGFNAQECFADKAFRTIGYNKFYEL